MKELIKKLIQSGKEDALTSEDGIRTAAKEIGIPDSEVEEALRSLGKSPLDEEELAQVTGGFFQELWDLPGQIAERITGEPPRSLKNGSHRA